MTPATAPSTSEPAHLPAPTPGDDDPGGHPRSWVLLGGVTLQGCTHCPPSHFALPGTQSKPTGFLCCWFWGPLGALCPGGPRELPWALGGCCLGARPWAAPPLQLMCIRGAPIRGSGCSCRSDPNWF